MADFPSPNSAYGRWGLMDVRDAIMGGNWPSTPVADPYFPYVTMLLPGNGTNGAQNNTFLDSSASPFTITRNGNTTQGTFSPYGPNWSNAFDGDASGDNLIAVSANTANAMGTGDWTAEAWIFLNVGGLTPFVFDTLPTSSGSTTGLRMRLNASNQLQLWQYSSAVLTSTTAVTVGAWTHVALVKSSGTTTAYINGTASNTYSDSGNYTCGSNRPMIGSDGYNNGSENTLNGYISNLRLVKGTAVYTGNFTPSTTPLTAITNTSLLACQSNRFKDNSSNNFTLTANGTPSVQRFSPFSPTAAYSTSVIGGSGYFDGSGDNLVTSGTGSFNPRSTFTVEFWTYPITNTTVTWINSNTNDNFYIETFSGTLYVGDGSINTISTTPPALNCWTNVLLSFDGTTYRLFYNGVSQASSTSLLASNTISAFRVGQKNDASRPFNGYISDMRVLVGTALYTSAFTPPTAPLTAISNTTLLLSMINAGIIDNAMMNDLETVGNAQISTSVSKFGGGSMAFDGTGDYLFGPTTPTIAFNSGAYTVEFWLYKDSTGTGERGILQTQTASLYGLSIFADGTTIYIDERKNAFDGSDPRISGTISQDTWVYITVCRQTGTSGTLRAFVNGTQIGSSVTSNLRNMTSTGPIYVGNTAVATNPLKGYIDDLRITNGIARYTATFTPPTQALSTF
jgi:hypothetical protein